jgi:Zn-dependent protease
MQQTALNLIAIGVFVISISTLFAPIFHISPTIPAAVTIGILGLATVDTLGWQNRGVTLLLDTLAGNQQRKRVLHHEAGHFLAAYFLGVPILGYTLTAWEAIKQGETGAGGVVFDFDAVTRQSKDEIPLAIDRFCTVLMAGVAAEVKIYGSETGGAADREKLRQTLDSLGFSPEFSQQKQRWAQLQAANLIERNQDSYQALVVAMQERKSVAECCEIVRESCRSNNLS